MTAQELVQKYIQFFVERGHAEIPSAPLIPENDPTVLFTTAGMHPLVPFLLGERHPAGTRLVDFQRCVRTGDIDEVGDATHNTFFTMLGNWSLGDYFKKESITWSYQLLTQAFGIDPKNLAVTVFEGDADAPRDEESAGYWRELGVAAERIAFLPKGDNWWGPAGVTGPCGPDTEIFFWTGDEEAPAVYDPKDKRWVEIWNNVFMQYNKQADGTFAVLAKPNVDTGLGLERTLAVLNGKKSGYDTELFSGMLGAIAAASGKMYGADDVTTFSMRVIADHVRTGIMIIADGMVPSNKDQGYVLRRLVRRAVRHARKLGVENIESLLRALTDAAVASLGMLYAHLDPQREHVVTVLLAEAKKFEATIQKGLKEVQHIWETRKEVTAKDAFDLYQSYGFPLELTEEVAREYGQVIDAAAFRASFAEHQTLSRAGAEKKFAGGLADHSAETTRLHTATHLLHKALKNILGEEVQQKGSNITAERLRFDFNYPTKVTDEQLKAIEDMVNEQIAKELPVGFKELTPEEAKASNAIGYFEDKYAQLGGKLKVYAVGDDARGYYSSEICGGPHVANTAELKHFRIQKEEAVSAGIRRIKATVDANGHA